MKKTMGLISLAVAAAAAAATFEDSPLFVKRTDPYSGVESYILKPKAYAFSQQSIYFTCKSVTDDGRFLIFNAWDSPTAKTNRLVAADVEKGTFREIPVGKSRVPIPYLDTKAAHVYWFDENGLHRFDLRGEKSEAEIVCPYPADLGPMHSYGTHLTLSEDRKTVFLDMRRRRKDIWVQGALHIDTGRFETWSETPHQMNHGQINPKNDRLAICAREYEWQGFDGKTHQVHGHPCTKGCPRMWLIEPGKRTWVEPQNGQHATHENWADDGKGLYWCANGNCGVWYHELASGRQSCLCPRRAVHASMDVSNRYVAFDNAIGARYRGNAWQVGFWNRETGVGIYPFTRMDPLMPDKKHASTQHPDPHPQFVMGGKYIVCTFNNADGHMDTAVIPVAPLVAKTAAAFAPAKILGDWPAGTDPATISRRLNEQLLSTRVEAYAPKGMVAKRGNYGGGSLMYCVASLMAHGLDCARLAGQKDVEERLLARFAELMATKDRKVFPPPGHVDNTIAGALPLEVAYLTGDKEALSFGLSFADTQWSAPSEQTMKSKQNLPLEEQQRLFNEGYTPETRFWIDDMYMITFLQVQAYRATGDVKYLNRAAKEMALYIRKLQRPDGLFDHAPGVPFVWGRGDGWVAGGLTLLMTHLRDDNPDYTVVQEGYLKMMNALLRTQRADGLWGQLVDDPGSWAETSGSAMFAFGFVTGVKRGLLDADRFGPAARKAYLALVGKLDGHANLADVCDGTVKKNDRQHYLDRPRVNGAPYGQAALMWICNALLDNATVRPACNALPDKTTGRSTCDEVLAALDGEAALRVETLKAQDARPYKAGFEREGGEIVCAAAGKTAGGACWTVRLDQKEALPLRISARGKVESGDGQGEALLYVDVSYQDGDHLWGVKEWFPPKPGDWTKRHVLLVPSKPIRVMAIYVMARGSATMRARFCPPALERFDLKAVDATLFDNVPVAKRGTLDKPCLLVRDVQAGSGFERADGTTLGVRFETKREAAGKATFYDVSVEDVQGGDRAMTFVWAQPLSAGRLEYFGSPRAAQDVTDAKGEFRDLVPVPCGAGGHSRWPFLAAAVDGKGVAIGLDPRRPGFSRVSLHARLRLLYAAFDVALVPEKKSARVGFVLFPFEAKDGFRGALEAYQRLFPEFNEVKQTKQGNWMAFRPISKVEGWEDFGFAIKEGDGETDWDDAHGITTYHYTEPTTWWMGIKGRDGRAQATMSECVAEAERLAAAGKQRYARAWKACAFRDENGGYCGVIRNTPWCNGIAWNLNCAPGQGPDGEFEAKLGEAHFAKSYRGVFPEGLDGEYVDSSEMYVTTPVDYNRANFAGMDTPLVFGTQNLKPGVFKGMMGYEYVREAWRKVRALGRRTMANGTPGRWWWLAPYLDVMGTETNWLRDGKWQPTSDSALMYARAMSGAKPYCFLMNTDFNAFKGEWVDKYMQRALAYGMYPSFFSPQATSKSHYFMTPAYYNRDRALFKKYMPLCIRVGEAGWRPVNRLLATDSRQVITEQFGDRYATVYNLATNAVQATLTSLSGASAALELVGGGEWRFENGRRTVQVPGETVLVLDFNGSKAP